MSSWSGSIIPIIGILLIGAGAVIVFCFWAGLNILTIGASLVILGAFLGALGAVLFSIDSSSKQESLRLKSHEIADLNKKIAQLNEQIAGTVTGGESFCYLFPFPAIGMSNTIDFKLNHQGEYPVYDVFIRIWDKTCLGQIDHGQIFEKHHGYRTKHFTREELEKMEKDPKIIAQDLAVQKEIKERMKSCIVFEGKPETIIPKTSDNIMDPPIFSCSIPPGADLSKFSQKYSVSIAARNGQFGQLISVDVRNKRFHIYSKVEKVFSDSKRVVLREYESLDSEVFGIKLLK